MADTVEKAAQRLADAEARLKTAQATRDQSRTTADNLVSEREGYETNLKRQMLTDNDYLRPFLEAKNKALTDVRYTYDTDMPELQDLRASDRYKILGRRAGQSLSKFYTQSDIESSLRGTIDQAIGRAVEGYNVKAGLANTQAQRADQDFERALALERYERSYLNDLDAMAKGGRGGGGSSSNGNWYGGDGVGDGIVDDPNVLVDLGGNDAPQKKPGFLENVTNTLTKGANYLWEKPTNAFQAGVQRVLPTGYASPNMELYRKHVQPTVQNAVSSAVAKSPALRDTLVTKNLARGAKSFVNALQNIIKK